MLRRIRLVTFAMFVSLVLAGFQQGLFATAESEQSCTCYLLGFDCEDGNIDCNNVDDPFCTDACQDMASFCSQNWGEGWEAGCTDNESFSCACAPAGK